MFRIENLTRLIICFLHVKYGCYASNSNFSMYYMVHMLQKPTSLRLDQLDKSHCEENDGGAVSYPVIVHCGVRPAQLSYCGDPECV